jgi:hypothetical protein
MLKNPDCLIPLLFFTLGPLLFVTMGLGEQFEDNQGTVLFIFLVVVVILAFALQKPLEKGEQKVKEVATDIKEKRETTKNIKQSTAKYIQAKHDAQYLSDEFLLTEIEDDDLDVMIKLAYEETLVERGVLDSSKTHEKLAKIRNLRL